MPPPKRRNKRKGARLGARAALVIFKYCINLTRINSRNYKTHNLSLDDSLLNMNIGKERGGIFGCRQHEFLFLPFKTKDQIQK